MPELRLHSRPIGTVFGLLGSKEDDMTYALGWALAQSERLGRALLAEAGLASDKLILAVRLQEHDGVRGGRTDIEIDTASAKLIVEAKRGWTLPTDVQLTAYSTRIAGPGAGAILTLSESSQTAAAAQLPVTVGLGVRVLHRSWDEVVRLVEDVARGGGHAEKRLLRELVSYLKGLVTMQDVTSNLAYVVSVQAGGAQPWSGSHSPTSLVTDHHRYFHPVGRKGFPHTPPTYIGFRWLGRLQRVSHIDSYEVFTNPSSLLDGLPDIEWDHHFFYRLGRPLPLPTPPPRTGKLYRAQRVWVALDLLLTEPTIRDARDRTQARLAGVGQTAPT